MTDLEFVQRCASGDKQAWDGFVDKYFRLIYRYINSALRQNNPALATEENTDDIFHEIVVILSRDNFKKLKTFKAKNGCSLASWLRQVTVNYTLDYLRKQRAMLSLDQEDDDGLTLAGKLSDNSASARDTAAVEEKITGLEECIEALDADDKYFLEFHISRGLSLEAMKGLFRVSRGAIDMRKSRIVSRLRDCFKSKGFTLDY
ncbi:MAG: sigma-70 family RNA polymerase sigma factor [Candidatus Omnitrophota bacterium]